LKESGLWQARWKSVEKAPLVCEALVMPDAHDILLGACILEGMDFTINPKRELAGVHGGIVMHGVKT
jgi:hypothetical protein